MLIVWAKKDNNAHFLPKTTSNQRSQQRRKTEKKSKEDVKYRKLKDQNRTKLELGETF